ncbi:hypothetical protein GQ600_14473 [Phytophthora cactorum]|nr:hypothetical protein GQ600_14473 [Phytophthora cactorum]
MQPLAPMPTEAALFEEAAAFLDMNTTPFDSVQVFNTGKFPSSESIELLSAIDSPVSHSFVTRLKQAIESNAGTNRASVQLSNYYWRDCATKQRDERLAAEAEQKRLVAATNVQATYIDNLTKLLERRASTSLQESWAPGIRDSKRLRVETSDDAVFTALLKEVDDTTPALTSYYESAESGEVEYLEHVNKCIQPFDYETTYTSVWKVAGHPHRQLDREVFAGAAGQENTIAVKFRLERTLTTGTKVSIKQWLVVRRFIEKTECSMDGKSTRKIWDVDGSDRAPSACALQYMYIQAGGSVVGVFRRMLQDKIDEDEKRLRGAMEGLMIEDTLTIVDEYLVG